MFLMVTCTDFLVPSFLAAEDTQKQDRAAYVIQEFLRFCAFNPELPLEGFCLRTDDYAAKLLL
jgi:hypothetical protein